MKVVDIAKQADLSSVLGELANDDEVLLSRDGVPIARLTKIAPVMRTPGILAESPAWRDFTYDPAIFAALETDEELAAEGWPL